MLTLNEKELLYLLNEVIDWWKDDYKFEEIPVDMRNNVLEVLEMYLGSKSRVELRLHCSHDTHVC